MAESVLIVREAPYELHTACLAVSTSPLVAVARFSRETQPRGATLHHLLRRHSVSIIGRKDAADKFIYSRSK
ncbi:MAG: hypothetical protein ACM3VT_19850 [Solirubrobacterales bacterium]